MIFALLSTRPSGWAMSPPADQNETMRSTSWLAHASWNAGPSARMVRSSPGWHSPLVGREGDWGGRTLAGGGAAGEPDNVRDGFGRVWMSVRIALTSPSTTTRPLSRVASEGSPQAPVGEYVPRPPSRRVN